MNSQDICLAFSNKNFQIWSILSYPFGTNMSLNNSTFSDLTYKATLSEYCQSHNISFVSLWTH